MKILPIIPPSTFLLLCVLLLEQFYISFIVRFCTEIHIVNLSSLKSNSDSTVLVISFQNRHFWLFKTFFLEYKSAGVEESKTCFDFVIAQKQSEIQPLTSETDGGCRGRILRDSGLKLKTQWLIHILATTLYLYNYLIGGRLHAVNRVSKFVLFGKNGGRFLSSRSI